MNNLPDAPWVRDAELNGMPEADEYTCPVCGAENPAEIYTVGGDAIGCCRCVRSVEGWYWAEKQREADKE